MTKRIFKLLILWFIIGAIYYALEGIWHMKVGGYANIVMLPVGGLCGICIGALNQVPRFYNSRVIYQALIGMVIILLIEFLSGVLLNIMLDLNIWDYSDRAFNIMGQICLHYGILWFLISPFAIWLEDTLRYKFWDEGEYYSLLQIYKEFVTLK